MKAEIRGHDGEWRVFYPEEGGLATPVAVYDRDGKLARTVDAGGPTGKMVEAHHVSPTRDEAESYARYLGADEVKFVVTERRAPRKARDEVPVWQQL